MKYLLLLLMLFTPFTSNAGSCTGNCPGDGIYIRSAVINDGSITAPKCAYTDDTNTTDNCTFTIIESRGQLMDGFTYYPLYFTAVASIAPGAGMDCILSVVYALSGEADQPNTYTGTITTGPGNDIAAIDTPVSVSLIGQTPIVGAGKVGIEISAGGTCTSLQAVSVRVAFRMVETGL